MNFAESVIKTHSTSDTKYTENGAMAYRTLNSPLVELFSQIGALRPRAVDEIETKFSTAFAADPLLATKMMFYAGNIRGGLGERRTFRICLHWLAKNFPDVVKANFNLIPHFNRWDAVFELIDTPVEEYMWDIIAQNLAIDVVAAKENKISTKKNYISLLAKWMPSETAHSKETRRLAAKAAHELNLTPRQYRKTLSLIRSEINVVETLMSAGKWDMIKYDRVPSYAMKNYKEAFKEHDPEGFGKYMLSLVKGEAKVNAATLFPYDLVHDCKRKGYNDITEAQWKALPNYVNGENNILVMADVSGSMYGRPMETSVGLATYFAQRNHGAYKGLYMTFTSDPSFIYLDPNISLCRAIRKVEETKIGYSTDLDKAFCNILTHAIQNHVSNEEMPKALVVISDMEIDDYFTGDAKLDFVEKWKNVFEWKGYTLPKLVMWNVEARNDTFLSQSEDVILVSGQSASTFKNLCMSLDGKTAWDFMLETLNDKMYDVVVV